jgi:hypothetical protein
VLSPDGSLPSRAAKTPPKPKAPAKKP